MSGLFSEIGGVTGGAASQALSFAAGFAAGRALTPAGVTLEQDAWASSTVRRLVAEAAAEAAADRVMTPDNAATEATYSGYEQSRFQVLYDLALTGPGLGELLTAVRRQTITGTQVSRALGKLKLDPEYDTAILDLQNVYLTPEQIALGIVRSVIADPGLLPVQLDTSGSNVAQYPVYPGNAVAEAAAGGVNLDRLRVMVGEIGLPMSTQQAASAFFRDIITKGAYYQSILEGDVRPEWADSILDQARQIPTAHDYIESHLRTWIDQPSMYAGTALHGMSEADTDLLFNVAGRPLPPHQITKGLARGGSYDGPTDQIPEAFLKAIAESNVRPEYYELDYLANQYTWPSYFVLKPLTAAGTITVDQATAIFEWSGWEPTLAAQTAASFVGSSSAAKQPTEAQLATLYEAGELARKDYVDALEARGYSADNAEKVALATDVKPLTSARTSVLTKLRNGVVDGGITAEQATAELAKTTIAPATIPQLVAVWEHEYAIEHPSTAPAG